MGVARIARRENKRLSPLSRWNGAVDRGCEHRGRERERERERERTRASCPSPAEYETAPYNTEAKVSISCSLSQDESLSHFSHTFSSHFDKKEFWGSGGEAVLPGLLSLSQDDRDPPLPPPPLFLVPVTMSEPPLPPPPTHLRHQPKRRKKQRPATPLPAKTPVSRYSV